MPISLRNRQAEPPADREPRSAAMPWLLLGQDLRKTMCCTLTEARLVRAYLTLFLVPWVDGGRAVRLARFGSYEVRLVELAHDPSTESCPLWLELYAHDIQTSIDSCGCDAFDDAVNVADDLIAHARELNQSERT
jgi:hypothetical protein